MHRHAIIKKCREQDKKSGRKHPKSRQIYCLWDSKEEKLLFAGPSKESAKQHEKAVQYYKHQGTAMSSKHRYIRLAEVPESAIKDLYNPKWGTDVIKAIGGDEDVSPKTSQYLFKTVWNAVIQLMDKALMSMYKIDTTEFSKDPTFIQVLAGLAYFVTDDGLKTALGVKSDSLQKAKGHVEALLAVLGKEADVDATLKGLKQQAAPVVQKAFDGIVKFLKEEMPDKPAPAAEQPQQQEQKAASMKKTAMNDAMREIQQIVQDYVDQALDFTDAWFDSPVGDHYIRDFQLNLDAWVRDITKHIYEAAVYDTGDVTGIDASGYVAALATILFKVMPAGYFDSIKDIGLMLNDIVDDKLLDEAFQAAVEADKEQARRETGWYRDDDSLEDRGYDPRGYSASYRKAEGWSDLPEGWTKKSVQKFWNSLTGDRKHKIRACMKRMEGEVDDPGAFCGGLAKKLNVASTTAAKDVPMSKLPDKIKYKGNRYIKVADATDTPEKSTVSQRSRKRKSRAPAMQMTQQKYKQETSKPAKQRPAKQQKAKPKVDSKVKQFFKKLFNFPAEDKAAQKEAVWGERVSSWGRVAAAQKIARKKGCGCRARSAGVLKLPTKCVEQVIGAKFSDDDTTTFEKKGNDWLVQGVASNGVVNDALVGALKSYCEMQTTAATRKASMKNITLNDKWYSDDYEVYGLWYIDDQPIAAAIGVPPYLQGTADAAGTERGLCSAWFEDSSDWENLSLDDVKLRDKLLGILAKNAEWLLGKYSSTDTHTAATRKLYTKRQAAALYDYETGDVITEGLQGAFTTDDAINAARDAARHLRAPVLLVDDDGEFVVYANGRVDELTQAVEDEAYDDPSYGYDVVSDPLDQHGYAPMYASVRKLMRRKASEENVVVYKRSGPGKFDDNVAEFVYERTLDGWGSEQLGDVQSFGYYELVVFGSDDPLKVQMEDGSVEVWGEAAILMENNQGFVYVDYYDTVAEAQQAWVNLEAEYDDYLGEYDEPIW